MVENKNNSSDIILYSSPEGNIKVEVIYSGETFWLTQKRLAELFAVEVPAVSLPVWQTGLKQVNQRKKRRSYFQNGNN